MHCSGFILEKTHIFSKKLNLLELNFEISQILNFDLNYGYLGFFYLSKIEFLIYYIILRSWLI